MLQNIVFFYDVNTLQWHAHVGCQKEKCEGILRISRIVWKYNKTEFLDCEMHVVICSNENKQKSVEMFLFLNVQLKYAVMKPNALALLAT